MFFRKSAAVADRRAHPRLDWPGIEPPGVVRVDHQGQSIHDAVVINISVGGVALRTRQSVKVGERLIFTTGAHRPPTHCEVLACEPMDDGDGQMRIRCRCIMGGFDVAGLS